MTNRLDAHELRQRRLDFALLLGFVLLITLSFWIHLTNLPRTSDPDALQNLAFARIFVDAFGITNNFRCGIPISAAVFLGQAWLKSWPDTFFAPTHLVRRSYRL